MFILVREEYHDEISKVITREIYASEDEMDAENCYYRLINDPSSGCSILNLTLYEIKEGKGDLIISQCDY